MREINVAVVGLGFMGATHIKAYRKVPGASLAAICDAARLPVDGDLSHISGNVGIAEPLKLDMTRVKATKNFDDLLADPAIDLIDLCVPTSAHPKLSIAALKAGKHVLCEKPLARTSALARDSLSKLFRNVPFLTLRKCPLCRVLTEIAQMPGESACDQRHGSYSIKSNGSRSI